MYTIIILIYNVLAIMIRNPYNNDNSYIIITFI